MARPRKLDFDDRYDESALNHDLTPDGIREQTLLQEQLRLAEEAGRDAARSRATEPASDAEYMAEAEEPAVEAGDRERGGYFEGMRDEERYDDAGD